MDQFIARFAGLEELPETLSLKGTIVTTDTLNCPRAIAQQIVDQGGDYALALKGKRDMLHNDVRRSLDDPESSVSRSAGR